MREVIYWQKLLQMPSYFSLQVLRTICVDKVQYLYPVLELQAWHGMQQLEPLVFFLFFFAELINYQCIKLLFFVFVHPATTYCRVLAIPEQKNFEWHDYFVYLNFFQGCWIHIDYSEAILLQEIRLAIKSR